MRWILLIALLFSGLAAADSAAISPVVFEFSETSATAEDPRLLAVAFHSLTFIDADGRSTGEVIFGTTEANELQGDGWFSNEYSSTVGAFQWAGGPSATASMQLQIPLGTEGLLFHMRTVADGNWVSVSVGGVTSATLRVESYWTAGYVPVGAAPQWAAREAAPEWTTGRYFPRFPSTDRVYVLRVRSALENAAPGETLPWMTKDRLAWEPDFRINHSSETMMALTLVGMQGVINRSGPSVYIDWGNDFIGASRFWVPLIKEQVEVIELDLDGLSAINFLWRRYAALFAGAVVYDPDLPDTINLATMLAGLEDRLMLAPDQLGLPGIPEFESVTDLRPLAAAEGWDTTEEGLTRLYQWVYDNLWPNLEHRIVGVISPGPPTAGTIAGTGGQSWPLALAARDYFVALRLPALWLDPSGGPQSELFGQFLEDAPSPIPVTGFFAGDEEGSVAFASGYGDWNPVINQPGSALAAGSLTVFSGLPAEAKPYQALMDTDRILATLGDQPVATVFSSDGDSIQFQMDRGYHGGVDFIWNEIQGHRFAWTANPTLAELAPLVWNYYVDSASDVTLISGLSGAGYMYPQLMDEAQLQAYLTHAAEYLSDSGLRVVRVSGQKGPWDAALATSYYAELKDSGYLGAIVGFQGSQWGLGLEYDGVPTPAVHPAYTLRQTNGDAIIADLVGRNPEEIYVDIAAIPYLAQGEIVADGDATAGQVRRFLGDATACCLIVHTTALSMAPGDYTITFRLKVSQNQATERLAEVYVFRNPPSGNWDTLASRSIAPADFQGAGEYQDFTLSFTLDSLTTYIEFRIDYFGGTDLYTDFIRSTRLETLGLPVFASVFIGLVTDPEPLAPALRFMEDFEAAGGIVLTPDEFMAALNPEFMIEWAQPFLGAGHPALVEASAQLAQGDFLTSLLTVRAALRLDEDNDGVLDVIDAFPLDPLESIDTDQDGIGNNADADDDNDGVPDIDDAFPLDATESVDTDSDGIGNNADTDDDNDGVDDVNDAFPLEFTKSGDFDGDGIDNNVDTDDDDDGVPDIDDAFPLDATETIDTDGDGIGNNADFDDDGDGLTDVLELSLGLDPLDPNDVTGSPREILWRHVVTGRNVLWSMESQHRVERNMLPRVADLDWNVEGMADFNGDGMDEIFFRHQGTGRNRLWTIKDGVRQSTDVIRGAAPNWFIMSMGDFDADGDADLMWRNRTTGANRYWEMDGTSRLSSLSVRSVGLNWAVAGSGDFDGDGRNDLFWRSSSGRNIIWLIQSRSIVARGVLPRVGSAWEVVAIGDFDADGKDDVLWHNATTGSNSIWLLSGAERKSRASIPRTSAGWRPFGVLDMNGDGMADVLWRNNDSGANWLWLMNGTMRSESLPLRAIPDQNWEPVAVGNAPN